MNDTVNQSKNEVSQVDNSRVKSKKKKKAKSNDNFVEELLAAINRVRASPGDFSKTIVDSISHIRPEGEKLIFDADGTKVAVVQGEAAFKDSANKLLDAHPCEPLELREDLVIPVPEDSKSWKDNKLIAQLLTKMKSDNASKYSECAFNMDLGVSDPETSLLLQVVDDSPFKGKRRDNILNPNFKYVGISFLKQKTKFCCYITFAK